jgi:hypothetical protein
MSTMLSFVYSMCSLSRLFIIQAALLRAVRYSSTLKIFQNERRAIRFMLLFNG